MAHHLGGGVGDCIVAVGRHRTDQRDQIVQLAQRPGEAEQPVHRHQDHQAELERDGSRRIGDRHQRIERRVNAIGIAQRAEQRRDHQQGGRGEERGRMYDVADQRRVGDAVVAPAGLVHPRPADDQQHVVDAVMPAHQHPLQPVIAGPQSGKEKKCEIIGGREVHRRHSITEAAACSMSVMRRGSLPGSASRAGAAGRPAGPARPTPTALPAPRARFRRPPG